VLGACERDEINGKDQDGEFRGVFYNRVLTAIVAWHASRLEKGPIGDVSDTPD
jgi:hypothetical protein